MRRLFNLQPGLLEQGQAFSAGAKDGKELNRIISSVLKELDSSS